MGTRRLEVIDAARVFATLGVIWTHVVEVEGHSTTTAALGRFGTSFYIVAALLFAFRSALARPDLAGLATVTVRARRLLKPYLIWCVVYGLLYARYAWDIDQSWADMATWWGPFAGTARHLWFLPFGFIAGTLASFLSPLLLRLSVPVLATCTVFGSALVYWIFQGELFFALDRAWALRYHLHRVDRWIEELPLVFAGTMLLVLGYRCLPREIEAQQRPIPEAYFAIFPALAFIGIEWVYALNVERLRMVSGGETRAIPHLLGFLLLGACLLVRRTEWTKRVAPFGRDTYFIFLVHIALLDAFGGFAKSLPGYGSVWFAVVVTVSIFAVSYVLAQVVKRVRFLRFLYPK